MYVSYAIYALLLAILIWGGKFAGFKKNQFHQDSTSLEVSKSLRGIAAICVILHHISQEGAFQGANGRNHPGELSIFVNAGFLCVAIFFFWSGFGLIKSLNKKENYFDGFLKKRVLKTILIPFYVNILLYAIYHLAMGHKIAAGRWITNFLGLTLMNEYAWYPIVLSIIYVAFYFIFKNVKNRKLAFFLMFLVIFLQGVFFAFNGHFAWWAGKKNWWLTPGALETAPWWKKQNVIWFFGEWWVNSSPAFLIGMLFAQFEEKITAWFKKGYWIKLVALVALYYAFNMLSGLAQWKLGYWSEYNGKGPGILNKFICYCSQWPQVSLFVILIFVIMMKYKVSNPITRFFGEISYESYMMNLIAIDCFRFILYRGNGPWSRVPIQTPGHYNLAIYAVAVMASSILLGLVFKWINKQITKKI